MMPADDRRSWRQLVLATAFTCISTVLAAQALTVSNVATLAGSVAESSGLIRAHTSGHWWTHNDSGGLPELYKLDSTGAVVRTVRVLGVPNVDWEELTADDSGYVYIGDFGNNSNNRQDLVIYKIPHPDLLLVDSVVPAEIHFSYADQVAFPPADSLLHYDMEAMVAWGDSLFLFSKNRTDPFDGYTRLHALPTQPGTYVTAALDSFYTGPGPMLNYWVCAAAVSPDREHLLLVSYTRGWLFSCFSGHDFFGGAVTNFTWSLSQKEGVAWAGNDTVYFTDERINGAFGGNLSRALVARYTAEPDASLGPDTTYYGTALSLHAPAMLGATYLWSTGETNDSILVSSSGTYAVTVTAPNGCTDSDSIDVQVLVALTQGQDAGMTAQVRGRGADAVLALHVAVAGEYTWTLLDLSGREVLGGKALLGAGADLRIAIGERLAAGVYVLRCSGPAGAASWKVGL